MKLPHRLDHLIDPRVRRFAGYWLKRRGNRPLPTFKDIDPVEIPWALPNIWLCEYVASAGDFRYRLTGEAIRAMFESNLRGRLMRDVVPREHYADHLERYRAVLDIPAIAHNVGPVYFDGGKPVIGERIILPLGDSELPERGAGTMLIGYTVYEKTGPGGTIYRSEDLVPATFVRVQDLPHDPV